MKLKRNYKKSLSTAILLCLMTGSVYAMPTGGNVVMGNVTNVDNPAEIMAANAHSIIDWSKFNIAANEKVTFNTNTFTVLNRVIGGSESQILGVLQDQGKGHLILMNPSGIVLGENSVIDANKLTLTSLSISETEFKRLINGKDALFEADELKNITVHQNAKISIKEALSLYGGKIILADGVEIVSKEYGKAGVDIFASSQVLIAPNGAEQTLTTNGASVNIGKAKLGKDSAALANLDVRAETVKVNGAEVVADNQSNDSKKVILLNGANIDVEGATLVNHNGDIDVVASGNWEASVPWDTFTAYPSISNKATVKDTMFKTGKNDVAILGANVDVYDSNISSGRNLIVGAVKEYSNVEGITTATTYDTSTVNVNDNTQVDVVGTSTVYGAIVNVDWKKFDQTVATTNPLIMWQGRNDISNEEIIEQAQKLKDKEEMQRILNMLQNTGEVPQDTNGVVKPVVPPVGVKVPDDFDGTVVVILNETDPKKSVIFEEESNMQEPNVPKDNTIMQEYNIDYKTSKEVALENLNIEYNKAIRDAVKNVEKNIKVGCKIKLNIK